MTPREIGELAAWLMDQSARLQYGEVTVKITIHDGTVRQTDKTVTERSRTQQAE